METASKFINVNGERYQAYILGDEAGRSYAVGIT